jgi:hypothetical protein
MPRRQRVPGQAESRGRAGCWTCKDKHVRCSKDQPHCARCRRLKLPCSYELRLLWQEDAIRRGISLGREGIWSKSGKTKINSDKQEEQFFFPIPNIDLIFLHTTCSHFENRGREGLEPQDMHAANPNARLEMTSTPVSTNDARELIMPLERSLSPIMVPSHESYLLDYFVSSICPSCSLSPTYNPYLYYITPMSFVYPPLHNAILSVSANQLRLLNHRRFEKDTWWYKIKTLEGLRESISSGDIGWPFVATILMLCFYDIADGCNESWMTHLQSGLKVMGQVSRDITESQQLRKFCLMYFVAHSIMGHTAGTLQIADGQYTWLEDDCIQEIDPLMGCSRGLLDIIHKISKAASDTTAILKERCMTRNELTNLTTTRNELERSLHTIGQFPPAALNCTYLTKVAEVKRQTALIYLHERLSTLLPHSPSVSSSSLASYKSSLITSVIEQISPLASSSTLLWPLFVLGNASPADEEHRRFVLERLSDILKSRNLGSVRLARKLVGDKYRSWDLELHGEMALKGKWISLA